MCCIFYIPNTYKNEEVCDEEKVFDDAGKAASLSHGQVCCLQTGGIDYLSPLLLSQPGPCESLLLLACGPDRYDLSTGLPHWPEGLRSDRPGSVSSLIRLLGHTPLSHSVTARCLNTLILRRSVSPKYQDKDNSRHQVSRYFVQSMVIVSVFKVKE